MTGVIVFISTYEYVTSGSFGQRVRRDVGYVDVVQFLIEIRRV